MAFLEEDIRRNVEQKQLIVVVGAGVSVGATRQAPAASWVGLLKSGVVRCLELGFLDEAEAREVQEQIETGTSDSLILAAETISQRLGAPNLPEYASWLQNTVGALSARDMSVVQELAALGCRIATTNYDNVLEEVTGFSPVTWREPGHAQQWFSGENPRQIMHLHGHWRTPASVVLGRTSYSAVLADRFAQALLQAMPLRNSLFFVGFGMGLADPNLRSLLEWIDQVLREAMNRHYRLVLRSEMRRVMDGHPRVFEVAYGEEFAALAPFLKALRPSAVPAANPAPPVERRNRTFFISYRHGGDDEALAKKLADGLKRNGHGVVRDVDLNVGDEWANQLRDGIKGADFFVVLLSASSVASEMVVSEVRFAWRRGRSRSGPRILPVRVNFAGPLDYELNMYLGRAQRVDWDPNDADGARVLEALLAAARGTDASVAAVAGDETEEVAPPSAPVTGFETPDERRVLKLAEEHPVTLTLFAPRAFGKTRLVLRYIELCKQRNRKIVHVDLNGFEARVLDDYGAFLSTFASEIMTSLEINRSPPVITEQAQMRRFMHLDVLRTQPGPLVLVLDHLHRIVAKPYKLDFFAMLRSWFDKTQAEDLWRLLGMVFVISTDPELLIENPLQSPFNIGVRVDLKPMVLLDCKRFDRAQEQPLGDARVAELYDLLGGHPQLTRRAYAALKSGVTFDALIETAHLADGPLGDHLRALWATVGRDANLLKGTREAILTGAVTDEHVGARLCAAGVLVRRGERYDPPNLLYSKFFRVR